MPWAPDLEGLRMEPRGYLAQTQFEGYEGGLTFPEPEGYRQPVEPSNQEAEGDQS